MNKIILSLALLFVPLDLLLTPQGEMVAPKVEHKEQSTTTTIDIVKRSCPDGYEGHYVDIQPGFDSDYWGIASGGVFYPYMLGSGPDAFTVCFKSEFMEQLRKNPEMRARKPLPPRAI